MNSVGTDLHKETTWFYTLDENGNKLDSKNIPNKRETLKEYFQQIPKPFVLAVEATYNWYFFVDMAQAYAEKVYLANSYELKAFAKRHKKTDKIDARLIAYVLHKGFLPVVTIADQQTRQTRELLRCRLSMVSDRCRCIFRLKSLLDKLGLDSKGNFATYKRLDAIQGYPLPGVYRTIVSNHIDEIKYLTRKLLILQKEIISMAEKDEDIFNLTSIPGLSHFSAALIKSEIIDISRFRSFNRLCAYAGLAPRVSSSGNKTFHGPLNNNRRKNLQWILLENVYHFIRSIPQKRLRYEKIKQRKGHNTAKVVLARDMLKIIYHVLKEKRRFYIDKESKIQSVATPALCGV